MKRRILIFELGILWVSFIAISSDAQITFERTYGGPRTDYGKSVQQTSDGGFIVAGWTASFGAGETDVYLVKTDSLGNHIWSKPYGGFDYDWGRSVQQTSDGGYIVSGETMSFGFYIRLYLFKTNSVGTTLWTKVYGRSATIDAGLSVQQTSDEGFIITGMTVPCDTCIWADVWLLKTDSMGDTLWTRTYGYSKTDLGWSVQQTSDQGFIIAGETRDTLGEWTDVYLIKTDSLGNTLWTRTYGGTSDDKGYSIHQTMDGGYIITGITRASPFVGSDVYLIKTDSLGDTLWTRTFGGEWEDIGRSVQQTLDGGYMIVGCSDCDRRWPKVSLIKTDSSGTILWKSTFGSEKTGKARGFSGQQTSDGGYVIAAVNRKDGITNQDVYLIKTDGNGMVVGIEESNDEYRTRNIELRLMQNSPNPFHNSTVIRYQIPIPNPVSRIKHHVSLKVYDLSGSLVKTLVNGTQDPGIYQLHWDGKDQSSGIYFYRLSVGDNTLTKKMILLR
jgi:hypothetical protein